MNWSQIVDKIYCITCLNDPERLSFARQSCADVGITFEIFPATNGHLVDPYLFEFNNIYLNHKGGAGCAFSHIRLYREIVNNHYSKTLVLEDDVIFHEQFTQLFPEYWRQVPNDMGLLFLGYCCYSASDNELIKAFYPMTTHAYIITYEAAKWFLENYAPCTNSIDIHLCNIYNQKKPPFISYLCNNRLYPSVKQKTTRLGVYFQGLVYQEHDNIPLSIHSSKTVNQYKFTVDWFSWCTNKWIKFLHHLHNQPNLKALEIGSYEGRSTIWLCNNLLCGLNCHLDCVDILIGSNDQQLKDTFDYNTQSLSNITVYNNSSYLILPQLMVKGNKYDLIFVDGSHKACDVLFEACLCFNMLKSGGIIIFDDFYWNLNLDPYLRPQPAIEAILKCFANQYELIDLDYQVLLRKK